MAKLLRLSLFLCLLVFSALGQAAEPLRLASATRGIAPNGYVEVLRDAGGQLSLHDVMQPARAAAFKLLPDRTQDLNFGYDASAYWLRFQVQADAAAAGAWLLEIAFPTLDDVQVFVPQQGRAWRMGDHLPFNARPIVHRNFVTPLPMAAGETLTVYLRVASEGSLTVPLKLWPAAAFAAHTQDSYMAYALYYGILLALGLYNLFLYFSLRDRNYLTYVAFTASMAVGQLSHNGFGNQYLWPDFPVWGNAAVVCGFAAAGFFGGIFTRTFLCVRRRLSPQLDKLILALIGCFALAALGPAFLPYRWCALLVTVTGALSALVAFTSGLLSVLRRQPGARYFLWAWGLLLVGVGVAALRSFNLLPTNLLTSNLMQVGSAVEMLLLSFALADRIQTARREKDEAQAEALHSKEAMLESLRQSEQLLEKHVSERTRELARANARLIASENKLSHMAHHDPLTGLPNRLLLHERLNSALLRAQQEQQQVAVLVVDLDGFKPVNDTYGHEAGDRLLVAVAQALRHAVRGSDTVARIGGDEFVVVLTPLPDNQQLCVLADRLAAAVKQANDQMSPRASISASIGIALYPEHGDSIHSLLQKADQAMYAAKNQGRDRWYLPVSA